MIPPVPHYEPESEPLTFNRRWSLTDREGVRHLPLRANDEDALWTPIACGGGINLPGSQTRDSVMCPDCIKARGQARRFGIRPAPVHREEGKGNG